ncbi:MAG TPA: hypothetical protein VKA09_01790 [Nitrososphaeraceae archaeon]|nr:hypothetical protein [Nitrososphaeraceae archaeon]
MVLVFLIVTLSIAFVGYSASSQSAQASPAATPLGRPTIFDLNPLSICVIFPDICEPIQRDRDIQIEDIPIPGPVCLSCPNLDFGNLNVNESLILTRLGGSVIVTKVPTESILNQDVVAQLNITDVTGNMSDGQ